MPELSHLNLLWLGAAIALLVGAWVRRPVWAALFCALALLGSGVLAVTRSPETAVSAFQGTGPVSLWATLLLLLCAALCLGLVPDRQRPPAAAGYALILLTTLGAILVAVATDLILLLLGALILSIGATALAVGGNGLQRSRAVFATGGVVLLAIAYGASVLYGLSGTTTISLLSERLPGYAAPLVVTAGTAVIAGLAVLAGIVPGHLWLTHHASALPPVAAAFLAVVPKLAALVALHRVLQALAPEGAIALPIAALLAAATMTWGNVAAWRSRNLYGVLAHSSTAQTGYLLMGVVAGIASGVGMPALLYYFGAYALAHTGAVAALAATGCERQGDQQGLAAIQPGAAIALLLTVLSLAAVPPMAGFIGRFGLLAATMDAGMGWLAAIALANTVFALLYYLRICLPMFLALEEPEAVGIARASTTWLALACGLASIAVGIAGSATLLELPKSMLAG